MPKLSKWRVSLSIDSDSFCGVVHSAEFVNPTHASIYATHLLDGFLIPDLITSYDVLVSGLDDDGHAWDLFDYHVPDGCDDDHKAIGVLALDELDWEHVHPES